MIPDQAASPDNPNPADPYYNPNQADPYYNPNQAPDPYYNPMQADPYNNPMPGGYPPGTGQPPMQEPERKRYTWVWFVIPGVIAVAVLLFFLLKGSGDSSPGQTDAKDTLKTEQPTAKDSLNTLQPTDTLGQQGAIQNDGNEQPPKQDEEIKGSEEDDDDDDWRTPKSGKSTSGSNPAQTTPTQPRQDEWPGMLHQNGDVVRGEELLVGFPNSTEEEIVSGLQDMVRRRMISQKQYDEAIEALERAKMQ